MNKTLIDDHFTSRDFSYDFFKQVLLNFHLQSVTIVKSGDSELSKSGREVISRHKTE